VVKQEDLELGALALRSPSLLQRALEDELPLLVTQSEVLQRPILRESVRLFSLPEGLRTRTTASPFLKTSCWSSWARLNRFSLLPVSTLTRARNSRTSLMTFGRATLSGLSSDVCFKQASSSRGYRASRVVGLVR
jgi:hypothetical protein